MPPKPLANSRLILDSKEWEGAPLEEVGRNPTTSTQRTWLPVLPSRRSMKDRIQLQVALPSLIVRADLTLG